MRDLLVRITKFLKRGKLAAIGAVVVMGAAGAVLLTQPQSVAAACTPHNPQAANTNIVYCGLSGSDVHSYVQSLNSVYQSGNGGNGNADIKTLFNSTGASAAILSSDTGWTLGKTNGNGTITDSNGKVVATAAYIYSRCSSDMSYCQPTSKYTHVSGNVYKHAATFFTDTDANGNGAHGSVTTLMHINQQTGAIDFAIWPECGNMVTFTPKKPVLQCKLLTLDMKSQDDTSMTYQLTVTGYAEMTPITSYRFSFGDGSSDQTVSVSNNATTATTTHVYAKTAAQQTLTATAYVNGAVTSPDCQKPIIVFGKTQKSIACVKLDVAGKGDYTFTATAAASNTSISGYNFFFDDGTSTGWQNSNTTTKTLSTDKTHAVYFLARDTQGNVAPLIPQCKASTQLLYTGPGDTFAIFGIASTIGAAIHQLVIRRKLLV